MLTLLMFSSIAQTSEPSASIFDRILATGPIGLILLMVIFGWLITKGHAEDLRQEARTWQAAYEKTRDALAQREHVDSVVLEQGRLTVDLLNKIQERYRVLDERGNRGLVP